MTQLKVVSWNVHWGASRVPERPRGEQFDPLASLGEELLEAADVVIFPECWRAHDGSSFLDRMAELGFSTTRETRYRTLQISRRGNHLADPGEGWWNLAIASRHEILATTELPLARSFQDVVPIRRAISIRIAIDKQPVDVTAFHVSSKVWFGAPAVQLRSMARLLRSHDLDGTNRPAVIAGDANLWRTFLPSVLPGWRMTARGRTFPSWRPHSQIDHICIRGAIDATDSAVLPYSPTSDHRAIRATLQLR